MTASLQPESKSPSRRALLAGALGGLGAWAASALGRASPARATDGDVMLVGAEMTSETTTKVTISAGFPALWGSAPHNDGLRGESGTWVGVRGISDSFYGVYATSGSGVGMLGVSGATADPAVRGHNYGNSTGVQGYSGTGSVPAAKAKTGVYGYAAQDAASVGVRGESPDGFGIYGKTTGTGFAGYFNGKVFMSQFVEIAEMSTPAAPLANRARLFVRDNGAGKTQLCVRFHTGAVQVIKTEL